MMGRLCHNSENLFCRFSEQTIPIETLTPHKIPKSIFFTEEKTEVHGYLKHLAWWAGIVEYQPSISGCSVSNFIPANGPGKAAEDEPSTRASATQQETWMKF